MRRCMLVMLGLLCCCPATAEDEYIDTTYDYISPWPDAGVPTYGGFGAARIPWESIPNYDIRGSQLRTWSANAQLHLARKSQFANQYAAQASGVWRIRSLKEHRRAVRLARLRAGINPWTGKQTRPSQVLDPVTLAYVDKEVIE